MSQTLEKRVEELERKVTEIVRKAGGEQGGNWLQTFGLSREDEGFEEMVRSVTSIVGN